MISLFNRRKPVDEALRGFVEGLSQALGDNLLSVLLYGSKVSGEYRDDRSDVNLFIVLDQLPWITLPLLGESFRLWVKAGYGLPVFIKKSELPAYAKSLPIEFLDMQDHHQVLFGVDPLKGLAVDRTNLRAQCESELTVKHLKLRRALSMTDGNVKRLRRVLVETLPSVLTLFRAVVRLESEAPKGHKILAAKDLAKRVGFDGECLEQLWDFHMRRQSDNLEDLARQYLEIVERVLVFLHRK